MSGGGGTTQTTSSQPWEAQRAPLTGGYEAAQNLLENQGTPTYYPGQTYAGLGQQSQGALGNTWNYASGAQGNRAGAQNALNTFAGGGMGDWGTVGQLRDIGGANNMGPAAQNVSGMAGANDFQQNPAYGQIAGVTAGGGMHHARNLYDRTSDIVADGARDPMMARMEGLLAGGGMNLSGNLYDRIGDLTTDGGNVAAYSSGKVDDITASGAGSNSQIRGDTYDLITGQAQNANPAFPQLQATASGAYLNSNPYLDATFNKAADKVRNVYQTSTAPTIDMDMAAGGRYGSGLHASRQAAATGDLGETLNNLATGIYGGNYATERQNQLGAASTLGGQYLQGQGLRASTAGQSAAQAAEDARLRLAATGQVAGDMSGDAARRMAASKDMTAAEQGDWSNLMAGMDRMSQMHDTATGRRMQASDAMTRAEGLDFNNMLAGTDRMSSMYDTGANRQLNANQLLNSAYQTGADRQINALNTSGNMYLQNRGQQLQGMGMMPQFQDMDYRDLQSQMSVGQTYDADRQGQIQDALNRYNFNQNAPWQQLQQYMSIIGGGTPGTVSSTTTGGGGALGTAGLLASLLGGAGQFASGTRGLLWG